MRRFSIFRIIFFFTNFEPLAQTRAARISESTVLPNSNMYRNGALAPVPDSPKVLFPSSHDWKFPQFPRFQWHWRVPDTFEADRTLLPYRESGIELNLEFGIF